MTDTRFQRRIQRYGWDKAGPYYDELWRRQLAPAQRRMLELAALRPGERVVDVACGTGLVTFPAAEAVAPDGRIVGLDISQKMIDLAGEKRSMTDAADRVTFGRAEAESLGQPDGSFDVALCGLGLMYVAEPVVAAREMLRVLRPGGRVAVAVWGRRERCGWAEIFEIVDARVRSAVCPLFFQQGTGDALARTLERAGFASVESERLTSELHYPSAIEAVGAAFAGGPVALAYSRFDAATRDAAHAEYLDSIAAYRDGDGYRIPGEFVIARATKP